MKLGCDLGEGAGHDDELVALIDLASVGCGAHAGSLRESLRVAGRCWGMGLIVGAHPGYPDREHFGRLELGLTLESITELIEEQVERLAARGPLTFIKPHGALYHRCQQDLEAARALARVGARRRMALMGQPGRAIVEAGSALGVQVLQEVYADRRLAPDGSLVPRSRPGAILSPKAAARQARRLLASAAGDVVTVHGDSPRAVEVASAVRRELFPSL